MPRNRFSDVRRGALLNAAYTKYIQKISNPELRDPNSRGPRPEREIVGITPYGFGTIEGPKVRASRPKNQSLNPSGLFTANTKANVVVAPANAMTVRGFIPAQVTCQQGSRSVSVTTSKFTGLRYLKYNGLQKFVSPFGRNAATDLELEARDAIRSQFLNNNEATIKRVSFRAEARSEYQ